MVAKKLCAACRVVRVSACRAFSRVSAAYVSSNSVVSNPINYVFSRVSAADAASRFLRLAVADVAPLVV